MVTAVRSGLLADLGFLGSRLITDTDVIAAYREDQAGLPAGMPAAVALPESTGEVALCLAAAHAMGVAVVTRGAGSGLSGGANALEGCLQLSTARMDRVLDMDPDNLTATVQPGLINGELKRRVREHGLEYPPDPASFEFSTLGGNIATNAGGLCCVKYGVTGDFVLGLEVVLADGTVIQTGGRTMKGVVGYDLTALMVGSEGTLGVVTGATLRLRPKRPAPATLVALFADLRSAGQAIARIRRNIVPALLELMDGETIRAVESFSPLGLDRAAEAMVLVQSDAGGTTAIEELSCAAAACRDSGAFEVIESSGEQEANLLMQARRLAFLALEQLGDVLLDDVAVPCSAVPELLARISRIGTQNKVRIGTFGHAGDGNMHPTIVFDRQSDDSRASAMRAFDEIILTSLELGGTATGEHGVGQLKRPYLDRELGSSAPVHRLIKHALDPTNILNPGRGI